jgi:hypothetical protein
VAGIMRGAENAGPEDGDSAIAAGEPLHNAEIETNAPTNSARALRTSTIRVMDVFRTGCYAKPTFIHAVEACTRSMGYLLSASCAGNEKWSPIGCGISTPIDGFRSGSRPCAIA